MNTPLHLLFYVITLFLYAKIETIIQFNAMFFPFFDKNHFILEKIHFFVNFFLFFFAFILKISISEQQNRCL